MYNRNNSQKNSATRKPTFPRFTEMQDCEMTVFAKTRKTRAGDIRSFSTSIGSKDSEGNWSNMFVAVRFPRSKVIDEDGRHDLHILNAFWSFEEYDKGDMHIQKPVIVIMDYEEM